MAKKRKSKKTSLKSVKKRFFSLIFTIGIVATLSILGFGLWTMRNILKPISLFAASQSETIQTTPTSQQFFFTLTLDSQQFVSQSSLVVLDEDEKTINEITLPPQTLMQLPYGLNQFKLQSLYKVAQLEQPKTPSSVVTHTLTGYFGVPGKDMYITQIKENEPIPFNNWMVSPNTIFNISFNEEWAKNTFITDKSRLDLLKLIYQMTQIPDQNKTAISILDDGIATRETLKDGSIAISTDENKLDAIINRLFQNNSIAQEKANIIIENATTTNGLASKLSRTIKNIGGIVIETGNIDLPQAKTTITVNDKKWITSTTLQKILTALPDSQLNETLSSDKKSDIVITLGDDYVTYLTGSIL